MEDGMLVKIREASRLLGVSPEHISRQIKAGKWPYYRLGPKAFRIDVEEIKKLGRLGTEENPEKQNAK